MLYNRRRDLCAQLRQWQLKVIENVKRGQHKKSLDKLFQGFKPAVEACYFNWEEAYPISGITYCSTDKKNSFCWVKAFQQRTCRLQCSEAVCEGGRAQGHESCLLFGDRSRPSSQEMSVRPKELVGKRKVASEVPQRVLRRLSTEGGEKAIYKSTVNKTKIPASKCLANKHGGKRRMSSEDSSLEPDMAEMNLDDSSLALGAEASNTFSFIESPLSRRYRDNFEDEGGVYYSEGLEPAVIVSTAMPKPNADAVIETSATAASGEGDPIVVDEEEGKSLKTEVVAGDGVAGGGKGGNKVAEEGRSREKGEDEDDYQAYYVNPQEVAKPEDEKVEEGTEEEQDIFAGIKPLDQENRMEVIKC